MSDLFSISRKNNNASGYIIWSQDQIAFIIQHYLANHSTTTIANLFNVSNAAIRNVLRKNGVKVLSISELSKLNFPRNSNYFEIIDTPAKAYWLGFLYADGYVSKDNAIRINLKRTDEGHLKKFLNALEYNGKVHYSEKHDNGKTFYQAYCSIKDKKMALDLADKGCVNNKSLILTFPYGKIPEGLYFHFIRGYFDGDGSFNYTISGKNKSPNYRLNFVGTEQFLTSIKQILGKDKLALEHKGNYCALTISGNRQLKRIMPLIYKDSYSEIELSRKRQIYDNFLLQPLGGEPVLAGCEQ